MYIATTPCALSGPPLARPCKSSKYSFAAFQEFLNDAKRADNLMSFNLPVCQLKNYGLVCRCAWNQFANWFQVKDSMLKSCFRPFRLNHCDEKTICCAVNGPGVRQDFPRNMIRRNFYSFFFCNNLHRLKLHGSKTTLQSKRKYMNWSMNILRARLIFKIDLYNIFIERWHFCCRMLGNFRAAWVHLLKLHRTPEESFYLVLLLHRGLLQRQFNQWLRSSSYKLPRWPTSEPR